jgi:ABC-type transporter Mla subunit MlaD
VFKNLKLGTKLISGYSIVAAITLALGIVAYYGAVKSGDTVEEIVGVRMPSVDSLLVIKKNAENIRGTIRTLAIPGLSSEVRQRQYQNLQKAREEYEKAWKVYEPLPHTEEEAAVWRQFVPAWDAWRKENNLLVEEAKEIDRLGIEDPMSLARQMEELMKDHYLLIQKVLHAIHMNESFEGGGDHMDCNTGRWLPTFKTSNAALAAEVEAIRGPHQKIHEATRKIKELIATGVSAGAESVYELEMIPAVKETFLHLEALLKMVKNAKEKFEQSQQHSTGIVTKRMEEATEYLDKLIEINHEVAQEETKNSESQVAFSKIFSLIAMIIGVSLALALGILITRSITKPLRRIIEGLDEGAGQVASASGQVSSASQALAEGASEQAASIEETSSSLEEMSSMTKQNAENAGQANSLMDEAKQVVGTANASMNRLTESMGEISKASEETSKIIKTIDEIAFQTNLLALNAAVEAARAGEAGAGFAVVADEVRNLAMRAAEAAKNTGNLIEGTVKRVKDGSVLVKETNEIFQQVAASASKVAELVAEINAASNEQAQGIDQVNKAVAEMDKVVQQNAANAEESASASEEMNAQAEQMKVMVTEMVAMVGGASVRKEPVQAVPQQIRHRTAHPSGLTKALVTKKNLVHPEQVIPFSDDEFKDF